MQLRLQRCVPRRLGAPPLVSAPVEPLPAHRQGNGACERRSIARVRRSASHMWVFFWWPCPPPLGSGQDADGETALDVALLSGNPRMIESIKASTLEDMTEVLDQSQSPTPLELEPQPVDEDTTAPPPPSTDTAVCGVSESNELVIPSPPQNLKAYSSTSVSRPYSESESSATYRLAKHGRAGLELRPTSTLRCMLPTWSLHHVLHHVALEYRTKHTVQVPDTVVHAWGCKVSPHGLGSAPIGGLAPVVIHTTRDPSWNGRVGMLVAKHPDVDEFIVESKSGERFRASADECDLIEPEVRWWNLSKLIDNVAEGLQGPAPWRCSRWASPSALCVSCVEVSCCSNEDSAALHVLSLHSEFSLPLLNPPPGSPPPPTTASNLDDGRAVARSVQGGIVPAGSPELGNSGAPSPSPPTDDFEDEREGTITFHPQGDEGPRLRSPVVQKQSSGNTALHWAAWKNHVPVLQMLLSQGADSNTANNQGATALHWAARRGSLEAARVLLREAANTALIDAAGKSAVDVAEERGFTDMVLLLRRGFDDDDDDDIDSDDGDEDDKPFDVALFEQMKDGGLGAYDSGGPDVLVPNMGYHEPRFCTIAREYQEKLGVRLQSSKEHAGTLLRKIAPGGAAARASTIKEGDLIVAVDGRSVFEHTHKAIITLIANAPRALRLIVVEPAPEDIDFLTYEDVAASTSYEEETCAVPEPITPSMTPARSPSKGEPSAPSGRHALVKLPAPQSGAGGTAADIGELVPSAPAAPLSNGSRKRPSATVQTRCALADMPVLEPEPKERVVLSHPDNETSTTVVYDVQEVVMTSSGAGLRIVLPVWACTRVLRHVRVFHRVGDAHLEECVPQGTMGEQLAVFQTVKAWGCCLLVHDSRARSNPYMVPGSTVMLHGFLRTNLDGHLCTILCIQPGGMFDVQLKGSGQRLLTSADHLRGIQGDASWWEYRHGVINEDIPFSHPDVPHASHFDDWSAHVGLVYAGAVELGMTGKGSSIVVSRVEIELFPEALPANACDGNILIRERIFESTTKFVPIMAGPAGLRQTALTQVASTNVKSHKRAESTLQGAIPPGAVQVGKGWTECGRVLVQVNPLDRAYDDDVFIDANGVLRIPLTEGHRVLSVEAAFIGLCNAQEVGLGSPRITNCDWECRPTVWCKVSRSLDQYVFNRNRLEGVAFLSGGPPSHDFVAVDGDEIQIGTDLAPAWLLGFRVATCTVDRALQDINMLRHAKRIENENLDVMATRVAADNALKNLIVDNRNVSLNTSDGASVIAHGSFGEVWTGLHRRQPFVFKPLPRCKNTEAAGQRHSRIAGLALGCNHRNVAAIRGVCLTLCSDPSAPSLSADFLMLDRYPLGSLRSVLNGRRLQLGEQISVLVGICDGMLHLHSQRPTSIIHGDLKAANVLIQNDMTPCVSDFGLSQFKRPEGDRADTDGLHSLPWMAPERLGAKPVMLPTVLSDVYAFGILLFEVATGEVPWLGEISRASLTEKIRSSQRPLVQQSICGSLKFTMEQCWHHRPEYRPRSFYSVGIRLRQTQQILALPSVRPVGTSAPWSPPAELLRDSRWVQEGNSWQFLDTSPTNSDDLARRHILTALDHAAEGEIKRDFADAAMVLAHSEGACSSFSTLFADLLTLDRNRSKTLNPQPWERRGNFLRCEKEVANSAASCALRAHVVERLSRRNLFPCCSNVESDRIRVHMVFVKVDTVSEARECVESGFSSAVQCGPLGIGVYASHYVPSKSDARGAARVMVAAFAIISNPYPVTFTETPSCLHNLVGAGITPGYGAHVAFTNAESGRLEPQRTWHVRSPSTVIVLESNMLLPFAIISK